MNSGRLKLRLLTPCFAAGARPDQQAEIRATAIRGQLRWWFRALGGFASLRNLPLASQETLVFGGGPSRNRRASPLTIRITAAAGGNLTSRTVISADAIQNQTGPATGYLLHALQRQARIGFFDKNLPVFDLDYHWHGPADLWDDLNALLHVFGHWGSLGYRSRRAFGALGFQDPSPSLESALQRFAWNERIVVKQMPARDALQAIHILAQWLRKWRNYGRSPSHLNTFEPALNYTRQDHNAGLNRYSGAVYRAALGLPIHQVYHNGRSVEWLARRPGGSERSGHFASPVILRPYRASSGRWLALLFFFDAKRWPEGHKVYLNGQPHPVSRDLYEAMKHDPALKPFLP
jgi:CRISPR type III-B/RAMP module RAMP protein Cmr1